MKIIYPPLVEQGLNFFQGSSHDKASFYRQMVRRGLISPTGEPTQLAIDNGWVKDFYEAEDLSFTEFIDLYPYFRNYPQDHFQLIDGFWEIPTEFKDELQQQLLNNKLSFDERQQIESYLEER